MSDIVQDSEGQEFVLETHGRSSTHSPFGGQSLRSALGRAASIRTIVHDSANRDAMARALVRIGECSDGEAVSLTLEQIGPMVEAALASGALSLSPYQRNLRPICDIEKVEPAEAIAEGVEEEEVVATHTLEIELVDEADVPVANEPFRVELPDGDIVQGRLNARGQALLTGIKSGGNCKVTFPRLDEAVWGPG